jgi:hypothetical protein
MLKNRKFLYNIISQIVFRGNWAFCKGKTRAKQKNKAIIVKGRGGLQGSEILRIPHSLDRGLTDGGKVVRPTHRPCSIPQKHNFPASDTHFC